MMQFLQKNKSLIIAVVLFAAVIWGYSKFFKPGESSTPTDLSAEAVGSRVLALYASLQSVSLDQSIFTSPLYRNLEDFSTPLRVETPGRSNPFDVIGRD